MPAQTLRPYQQSGLRQILDAWKAGARSVLAVSPTGSGKTTLFGSLVAQLDVAGQRSVILAHRRELITQASTRLREFGVQHGLIMSGEAPAPYHAVQVASKDTLALRLRDHGFLREWARSVVLVVADEAHLSTAASWQFCLGHFPNARILGVTATPWRLSGKPLAGAYDACVVVATPRELREQGHLCDYVGFSYLTPDLSELSTTGDDYNAADSAKAMSQSLIVDNIVEEWLKHARELSTVVFAVTKDHSQQLTARFQAAGIRAEHLDGDTPTFQRDAILKRVAAGATRVLCNVGVAIEGLDIPRLKCCVLARPTKSVARYLQMVGRVRRPWEGVTARIHDHSFTIKAHGLPDAERDYSLNAKPEAPPSLTQCSECFAVYATARCPACNHENELAPQGERVLQTVAEAEQYEFTSSTEAPPAEAVRPEKPTRVSWETPRTITGAYVSRSDEPVSWGNGKRSLYLVRSEKRDYVLPGATHLDKAMHQVPLGAPFLVVTYDGRAGSGANAAHRFRVGFDTEFSAPRECYCRFLLKTPCTMCAP
jgi:DNA repair protein RadD